MPPAPRLAAVLTLIAALVATLVGAACSSTPPEPAGPALLLLGEVHDNAAGHALRLQRLHQQLTQGARPALLMEQFDRERQGEIDRLVQAAPGVPPGDAGLDATVDALVKLGGATGAGWTWDFYRPYLLLALQYRLPIVAANVSRGDARGVMQQGLSAGGFSAEVPTDIAAAHAGDIVRSHCGQINPAQAGRMALAQVARDQFMARQVEAYAARGVVLLAGNGHVRKDIGVPRWLGKAARGRATAVGYLETDDPASASPTDADAFDAVIAMPAQQRDDPCNSMRAPAAPQPAARGPGLAG